MAKMIIGGKKVDSRDGKTIEVINQANGKVLDTVPMATKEDVDEAVANAKKGQQEWVAMPLMEREKIFNKFLQLMEKRKRDILAILSRESGKHVGVSIFEYEQTVLLYSSYMAAAKFLDGKTLVPGTEPGHDGKTAQDLILATHEPLGVIAAIVPFNAPMLLYSYKVAPALAAGNAVIAKPPTDCPLTTILVTELLHEAGVPGNTLQIVTGSGSKVGDWLVRNPGVDGVSMTGSTEVGLGIAEIAAKRLAHVTLELGGNDAYIVMPDVDLDEIAENACGARGANSGQVCINSKRFIVHNSIKEAFTKKLLAHVEKIVVGYDDNIEETMEKFFSKKDATDISDTKMGPLINENAAKQVEEQVKHTISQGAKLLIGGKREGAFYWPTILTGVTKDMDITKNLEIFGPVWPIIGFDTVDEAIAIANSSDFGLSGCVFTKDWKQGMYVAKKVVTGTMVVNGSSMYRNMMQPFGGQKMSGLGNEGLITLEEMTKTKTIVLKGFLP
jgi:succinate-semialdehyde dehydrogenase/glutarate-semialdehyde dehydrogenase